MVASLREAVTAAEFDSHLRQALDLADSEASVLDVVAEAMVALDPARPMELLLADSSEAHLERVVSSGPAESRGCTVESPFSCAAVRNGHSLVFNSSGELGACPQLKNRRAEAHCAAVCVPVTFMGRALGVLHAVGPDGVSASGHTVQGLRTLATQAGLRIGTTRAFERSQLQASTDGLTGLLNRRSIEGAIRRLERTDAPYALLLADLDRFKELNDAFGHEAGDRALRIFARVLQDSVRPGDLAGRYGGEEFLVVVPGAAAAAAAVIAERLRVALVAATEGGDVPRCTVSIGVADSTMGAELASVLRAADAALYEAKNSGRNRTAVASPGDESHGAVPAVPVC
jgi:diguanylate cyclase (GGDEF)-like protein